MFINIFMKGFVTNIEKLSLKNNNFRNVLYTDKNSQLLVVFCIVCTKIKRDETE